MTMPSNVVELLNDILHENVVNLQGRANGNKGGSVSNRDEYLLSSCDVKDLVTILTLGYGYGGKVTARLKTNHLQDDEQARMQQHITEFCKFIQDARPKLNEIAADAVPPAHLRSNASIPGHWIQITCGWPPSAGKPGNRPTPTPGYSRTRSPLWI